MQLLYKNQHLKHLDSIRQNLILLKCQKNKEIVLRQCNLMNKVMSNNNYNYNYNNNNNNKNNRIQTKITIIYIKILIKTHKNTSKPKNYTIQIQCN